MPVANTPAVIFAIRIVLPDALVSQALRIAAPSSIKSCLYRTVGLIDCPGNLITSVVAVERCFCGKSRHIHFTPL
jgi:hypothetical protein